VAGGRMPGRPGYFAEGTVMRTPTLNDELESIAGA
jgi:hypothetical protein